MAKLLTVKGKSKSKKKTVSKSKETNAPIKWGYNLKDETCFTAFKSGSYYYISSPLKLIGEPEIKSFYYIIEVMLDLDFDVVITTFAIKYKANIIGKGNDQYLRFDKEQDARNCKNFLNKALRDLA